jgi:hypothetical protein
MRTILAAFIFATLAGGCVGESRVGYSAGATVVVETPDLVEVSPGVQVIADYDEPIFYSDGFYWRYDNDIWYRSSSYTSGWVYIESPPVTIGRIDRPHGYVHYRPSGYVARRRPVPANRIERPKPVVRDHRSDARPAPAPTPVVRDHRNPEPTPVVRDHRDPTPPVVRDHRDEPARPPAYVPPQPAKTPAKPNRVPKPTEKDKDKDRDHR